jgi:P-type E1-E2 ATPase
LTAVVVTTSQYRLLPGRLRISIKGLLQNPIYAHYLSEGLVRKRHIFSAAANPLTGRALIHFDPAGIGLTEIQLLISAIEQTYFVQKASTHRGRKTTCNMPQELTQAPAAYALATGFVLIGLLIKRLFIGRSLWSSSPQIFSYAALATLISGYPLLRNKFETVSKKNNMNYELLLFLPTLVLLTMRESITGLSVLWLVQLTYWLGIATQADSRKNIYNLLTKKQLQALENPSEQTTLLTPNKLEIGDHLPTLESISIHKQMTITKSPGWKTKTPSSSLLTEKLLWWSLAISGITFFLTRNFMQSLAILLAGCPAAISLSRNTALHSAVGEAAEKEIFVKEVEVLERIGEVDTVLFDKTGTLTASHPIISKIIPLTPDYDENKILILAASSEKSLPHSLANMLISEIQKRDLALLSAHHQSHLIFGVQAVVEDKNIAVGNHLFMQRKKVPVSKAKAMALSLENLENSILYVAANKQLIGIIGVKDLIKPESYAGIDQLRSLGIKNIGVITGDSSPAAKNLTTELGLTASWHSMLPEDKVRVINDMQRTGKKIAMVGDGTNDSPAFGASEVGIAMGRSGTAQAIATADLVIANDDPRKVAEIIRLSRYTNRVIRQNASLSTAFNIIGMTLAATSLITPVTAGLLLNISTLAVIMNSKCLLSRKKQINFSSKLHSVKK